MSLPDYNSDRAKSQDRKLYFSILFSVFIHLAFLFYHLDLTPHVSPISDQTKDRFIELSELPPHSSIPNRVSREQPRNQVVETEDSGNREIDPNATMLSDKNQKAQEETRAQRTDTFQKGLGKGTQSDELEKEGENDISLSDSASKKKNWKNLSLKDLSINGDGDQASASDDYLPNVATGERTILSTREFRYFSYYNRIKDLLRQHWKPSIEREISKLWGKGQMLKENELVTRLLVLLDKSGQVLKISKVGASGVTEIDEVAVQAFYQASPFPNPPMGLVESDGYVRINWDFILQTAAAPQIQFRPNQNPPRFR